MRNLEEERTIKYEERKMEQDAFVTEAKKNKFIHEIKNGLGDLIKKEPNKPIKKVKWYNKLIKMFLND